MTVNDNPKDALRAAFKRRLLTGCITAAISLAVTVVLMLRPGAVATPAWIVAVGMGVVAAVANYILEQVMYRKGKNATIVLILTLLLPAIALAILLQCGVIPGADGKAGFPYVPTFILLRSLIPLIQLLRDGGRLREGKPCESIGRMKKKHPPRGERTGAGILYAVRGRVDSRGASHTHGEYVPHPPLSGVLPPPFGRGGGGDHPRRRDL